MPLLPFYILQTWMKIQKQRMPVWYSKSPYLMKMNSTFRIIVLPRSQLSLQLIQKKAERLSDAVHTSSSVGYMTSFSSILWFLKHRSAMKILLSIYSGVSRISCVAISHSLAMKVYNCLFVVRLKKYKLQAFSCM
jgi:hypothetical protein